MWHRDEARPTRYRGVLFRSALEAKVAEQLDKLNIAWKYEVPVEADGRWAGVCDTCLAEGNSGGYG